MRAVPSASHRLQDGGQADHLPGVLLQVRSAADHPDLHRYGRQVRALPMHAHGRQVRALPADRHLLPYGALHHRQASALLQSVLQRLLHSLLQEVPSLPLIASSVRHASMGRDSSFRGNDESLLALFMVVL